MGAGAFAVDQIAIDEANVGRRRLADELRGTEFRPSQRVLRALAEAGLLSPIAVGAFHVARGADAQLAGNVRLDAAEEPVRRIVSRAPAQERGRLHVRRLGAERLNAESGEEERTQAAVHE
jgi:hypothetical protein